MIKFDAVLRDEFSYVPYGEKGWKGITHEVLTVEKGFTGWIKVEKECKFHSFPQPQYILYIDHNHTLNQLLYQDTRTFSVPTMPGLSITTALIPMTRNQQSRQSG